ncbi:hypothetical protein CAMGR0001_1360 [Campylobacter gracilis RM3268]|uniref:Uncharacterized protein n=1 Tax=Campylobacter gracilis RM3268 TaxID=553220 RepID=C8PJG1_9BACT|nr:hypothetical protein CAMGR0001_1360 [Campylobacter gracilis RM3268]
MIRDVKFLLLVKTMVMGNFKILILAQVKFNDSVFCRRGIMLWVFGSIST